MRARRVLVVFALLALISVAAPTADALPDLVASPAAPAVEPAVTKALAASPTTDVVIGYRSKPTAADITALRVAGFTGPFMTYEIVDAVAATATAASIKAIAKSPRIERVEHDAVIPYTLDRATTVGRAKHLWNAAYQVDGSLRTGGITGRGVRVAIIDSGVDGRHEDIQEKTLANALNNQVVTEANFHVLGRSIVNYDAALINPDGPFDEGGEVDEPMAAAVTAVPAVQTDTGGHGTHVAGIVAGRGRAASNGRYKGVAPGAQLIGLGAGEALVVSRSLAAMDWLHLNAADYGVRIVNNSWGGPGDWNASLLITKAIRHLAVDDGLTMVFSAGNDAGDGTTIQTSVWANIPEVISVGNYYDRTGWVDTSSSRGLKTLPRTWPLISAPGTQIISTAMLGGGVTYYGTAQDALISQLTTGGEPIVVPAPLPKATNESAGGQTVVVGDYTSMTGTSMAAPFVAGVCALLYEANPDLTTDQIKEILAATANMPNGKTYATDGYEIGHGVVDATEAVAVALRLRDGDPDVATAVANASVDYTSNPVSVNTGTGPVSDNSIPLFPLLPGLPPISATGHIYAGGAIDPFLVGTNTVTTGEPVDFSARGIHANLPAIVLALDNFEVTFTIVKGTTVVAGPFVATNAADAEDFQATYSYTIPKHLSGNMKLVAELAYGPDIYNLFALPFTVQRQTLVSPPEA